MSKADIRKAVYANGSTTVETLSISVGGVDYKVGERKGLRILRKDRWVAVVDGSDTAVYMADDERKVLRQCTALQLEQAVATLVPPPAEVAHANEILGQLAIPHGYELVVRNGKPALVAKGNGRPSISATPRSGGKPRTGAGIPTFSLEKGEVVVRRKDSQAFTGTGRMRTRPDGKPEFEAKGDKETVWLASLSSHYSRQAATV